MHGARISDSKKLSMSLLTFNLPHFLSPDFSKYTLSYVPGTGLLGTEDTAVSTTAGSQSGNHPGSWERGSEGWPQKRTERCRLEQELRRKSRSWSCRESLQGPTETRAREVLLGKITPGRGDGSCEGPERRWGLACLGNDQKASTMVTY